MIFNESACNPLKFSNKSFAKFDQTVDLSRSVTSEENFFFRVLSCFPSLLCGQDIQQMSECPHAVEYITTVNYLRPAFTSRFVRLLSSFLHQNFLETKRRTDRLQK